MRFRYQPHLMCEAIGLSYDFKRRSGTLRVPEMNYVDMLGTINMFLAIDAKAEEVIVYVGNELDTIYNCQSRRCVFPEN